MLDISKVDVWHIEDLCRKLRNIRKLNCIGLAVIGSFLGSSWHDWDGWEDWKWRTFAFGTLLFVNILLNIKILILKYTTIKHLSTNSFKY